MIVADASPLIGLARIDLLSVLPNLYQTVLVPPRVLAELDVHGDRPGARRLASALAEGWLSPTSLTHAEELSTLQNLLDPGEAEAILLAQERTGSVLLIDDRRGRMVAWSLGRAESRSSAPGVCSCSPSVSDGSSGWGRR